MDIGQIFENNFDCYADTWQDNNDTIPPTMVEGDVVMAMTKEAFIKVFKELTLTDVSQQRELLMRDRLLKSREETARVREKTAIQNTLEIYCDLDELPTVEEVLKRIGRKH